MTTASLKKAFGSIGDNWMMKALRRIFAAQRSSFLYGSATYDPASLIDAAGATTTVTVTGAALGDFVPMVSFDKDLQGITVTAYVSAAQHRLRSFPERVGRHARPRLRDAARRGGQGEQLQLHRPPGHGVQHLTAAAGS